MRHVGAEDGGERGIPFRLQAGNGEPILTSEACGAKAAAEKASTRPGATAASFAQKTILI
jgi:hypothetical protein